MKKKNNYLENNIQVSLQKEQINLEDAIDIREIRNLKLANQLLKLRRKKKLNKIELYNRKIQMQTQSNAQAAQAAAQADIQKQQAITQSKAQLAQVEAQLDITKIRKRSRN